MSSTIININLNNDDISDEESLDNADDDFEVIFGVENTEQEAGNFITDRINKEGLAKRSWAFFLIKNNV